MRVSANFLGFRYQRWFRRLCRHIPRGWYTPRRSYFQALSVGVTSFFLVICLFIFVFSGVVPFQYTSHISRVAQDFSDWAASDLESAGNPAAGSLRPTYILVHIGDPNSTQVGKAHLARDAFMDRQRYQRQNPFFRNIARRNFKTRTKGMFDFENGEVEEPKCSGVLCFSPELNKRREVGKGHRGSRSRGIASGERARGSTNEDASEMSVDVKLEPCATYPAGLEGRIPAATIEKRVLVQPARLAAMFPEVRDGGHYEPTSCKTEEKTAIVIPYRDRWDHLHTLLPVLIPMLIRQQIDFTIYVVEQDSSTTFNKGLLFNAAYLEAMNVDNYDCFVLHDVDMIPLDDRNIYRCNISGPVHFSAGTNKFNYSVVYDGLFGGVVSFTRDQFLTINGASNMYFGWGAEDDDLRDRAWNKGFKLLRKPQEYGIYDMIRHRYGGWYQNDDRYRVFATRLKRQDIDGLNSAVYNITGVGVFPIYTWISVNFDPDTLIQTVPAHLRAEEPENEIEPLKPVTIEHLLP